MVFHFVPNNFCFIHCRWVDSGGVCAFFNRAAYFSDWSIVILYVVSIVIFFYAPLWVVSACFFFVFILLFLFSFRTLSSSSLVCAHAFSAQNATIFSLVVFYSVVCKYCTIREIAAVFIWCSKKKHKKTAQSMHLSVIIISFVISFHMHLFNGNKAER